MHLGMFTRHERLIPGSTRKPYHHSLRGTDQEIVGRESSAIRPSDFSRKYQENIEKTLSAFKRGRRIDAAQGRKARDIGAWLAIVLGRGSKPVYFALPRARTHSRSESVLVVLLCGGLALALSFLFRGGSVKPAAPAIFLLIIISVAHFWDRLAGLFVAVVGGLVFAAFLFEPYGSLAV